MSDKDHPKLAHVVEHLTQYVEANGATPGATLGQELRRHFSDLTLDDLGFRNLTALLRACAPLLSIVGRSGVDLLWGVEISDDLPGTELPNDLFEELLVPSAPSPVPPDQIRIARAHFEGYRSLLDVELSLSPLTLLVGANGSGKSNLLDALFRTVRLARYSPEGLFRGDHSPLRIRTRGHSGPIRCEIAGTGDYMLRWTYTDHHELVAGTPDRLESIRALQGSLVDRAFGPAQHLKLDASEIAQPTYSSERSPYVDHRGHHVPAVLASIAATDPHRFGAITDSVRRVVPRIQALRMPRAAVSREVTEVHYLDGQPVERRSRREMVGNALEAKIAGEWIPGDQLSEGTLLVIALHTILGSEHPPKLMLLDDLDRALHPGAQRALLRQLVEATTAPSLTVVATTHSPFVLDEVDADCVRVVRLDERGHTSVAPLTDAPAWQEWKGAMTAGEFWIYAGEDWLERA